MTDAKRIALFLDGTWNTVNDNTNVWRLKSLCKKSDAQPVYYSVGVGTQYGEKLRGGMLGYGLDHEVIDAYEWLIENFSPNDQIFIFGFSRGAYTARSLSGFISKCGLLVPGAALSVRQLYERYQRGIGVRTIRELARDKREQVGAAISLEERWMLKYSRAVPIKFIGVWDTVGALGIPFGDIPILSRRSYQFLETDLRINNDFAYHALAIDEHRKAFSPTLWTRTVPANAKPEDVYPPRKLGDVEQRWFVGAHSNVGGGCSSDLLAQLPLKWMMSKAIQHGLEFRNDVLIDGDENKAAISDSYAEFMYGAYKIATFGQAYYRPIGVAPITTADNKIITNVNETLDASVFSRWRADPTYRPKNLQDWAAAYGIDIGNLTKSVLADRPTESLSDTYLTAPLGIANA